MTTLSGWTITTANRLVIELPHQDFDSAHALVSAYLSAVGGWIPSDDNEPTGEGVPANGQTPVEAAVSIREQQHARMNELDAEITLTVKAKFLSNLTPGQDVGDVISQMTAGIQSFISNQFAAAPVSFVRIDTLSGTVRSGGTTTAEHRLAIQADIDDGVTRINPLSVALSRARAFFNIDALWNVQSYFLEEDKSIAVVIRKYTTTSYDSLSTETSQCMFCVDINTHRIMSGAKIVIPE